MRLTKVATQEIIARCDALLRLAHLWQIKIASGVSFATAPCPAFMAFLLSCGMRLL
jgi:hypothetical protein